jgi:hypothetical protein
MFVKGLDYRDWIEMTHGFPPGQQALIVPAWMVHARCGARAAGA